MSVFKSETCSQIPVKITESRSW